MNSEPYEVSKARIEFGDSSWEGFREMNDPFLTYYFQGFKFEFIRDYVMVVDTNTNAIWKITFNRIDNTNPFTIQLIERGKA
jgi:hypothetical protein